MPEDVYKRQVIKKRRKDIKNENYNQYFLDGSHLWTDCWPAVSYTHLDVYKRQVKKLLEEAASIGLDKNEVIKLIQSADQ